MTYSKRTDSHPLRVGAVTLAMVAAMGGGCGLIDAINQEETTVVQVFATHHATPRKNGTFPDRGGDNEFRMFTTDLDWEITLTDGFVSIARVELHNCAGQVADVDLFRGILPESLIRGDLERFSVGSVETPSTPICGLTVYYEPFDEDMSDMPFDDLIEGNSLYLAGVAQNETDMIPFELDISRDIEVFIDTSEMQNGQPLQITGEEPFPVELTIAKTYDRFFHGIDFVTATQREMKDTAVEALEDETYLRTNL